MIMYTRNHIKFSWIIHLTVSKHLKMTFTLFLSGVIPFQLPNTLLVLATSYASHCYKCMSFIRTIIIPPSYNAKTKHGGLCADPLEQMFMLNKLMFNCKLFTDIYL